MAPSASLTGPRGRAVALLLLAAAGAGAAAGASVAAPPQSASPAPQPALQALQAPEYALRAAFLYNFTLFVEWPEEARKGPLQVCVLGEDPFGPLLPAALKGKKAGGRELRSSVVAKGQEVAPCSVLYVPAAEAAKQRRVVESLSGQPVLTVGESEDFLAAGGVIRLFLEGGRLRFEVSPEAALRSRLKISARLLELSRHPAGGAGRGN